MTTTDEILLAIKRLREEVSALRGRLIMLEDQVTAAIEAPPIERRVVPPSVVGSAAALGEDLADVRRIARSSHESARALRRVVSPADDTGRYQTLPDEVKK